MAPGCIVTPLLMPFLSTHLLGGIRVDELAVDAAGLGL